MENQINLIELLDYIDPTALNYTEWIGIGMALKHEGYSSDYWDVWSRRDPARYHAGECAAKWTSFSGTTITPVTGGTIVALAKQGGWSPRSEERELEWDDKIGSKDLVVVDKDWIEGREINAPKRWNPVRQLITYIDTLFESTDKVGYVTRATKGDGGRISPSKGCWDRTAGQLIEQLNECNGDIGAVLGDYSEEVGAWIRFNPLDGKGIKNENVTEFRYALVESDSVDIEKQNAILRELELPIACLVHSGNKSLHAIVRIDAADYKEYRQRVDYLYAVCKKNGLDIDTQNRNPSRLSRMPGVVRKGQKQFLIDTNIGKASWTEWVEWIEAVNDDLPDPEDLCSVWNTMPSLAPSLIGGVLRQGHKMLLAGPSKAGKSYALIELCISIAEGKPWIGFDCAQGRVMYVNLELDRASCFHRFRDVYNALRWQPENLGNIDIWNLRGKSVPMDKLAPKLIRRAAKKNYIAIIIDPIYKVITGDENSADQMAKFCNQFDKVCTELGCAVIYCHHHSKGAQGGKRSMDRASGSGVFARDPDALLDLIELEAQESAFKQAENNALCDLCMQYLVCAGQADGASQDDACSSRAMLEICERILPSADMKKLNVEAELLKSAVRARTAWRIEGTLREFPKFPPLNLWFDYPIHRVENGGLLADAQAEIDVPAWRKANSARKSKATAKADAQREQFQLAIAACSIDGPPTAKALSEYFSDENGAPKPLNTIYRWVKKYGYTIDKNSGEVSLPAFSQS